jgi:hypothetical protein
MGYEKTATEVTCTYVAVAEKLRREILFVPMRTLTLPEDGKSHKINIVRRTSGSYHSTGSTLASKYIDPWE